MKLDAITAQNLKTTAKTYAKSAINGLNTVGSKVVEEAKDLKSKAPEFVKSVKAFAKAQLESQGKGDVYQKMSEIKSTVITKAKNAGVNKNTFIGAAALAAVTVLAIKCVKGIVKAINKTSDDK